MMIIINILACNAVEGDLQGARRGSGHPVAIQIRQLSQRPSTEAAVGAKGRRDQTASEQVRPCDDDG